MAQDHIYVVNGQDISALRVPDEAIRSALDGRRWITNSEGVGHEIGVEGITVFPTLADAKNGRVLASIREAYQNLWEAEGLMRDCAPERTDDAEEAKKVHKTIRRARMQLGHLHNVTTGATERD